MTQLRAELERARAVRSERRELAAQHAEIDRLEEHLSGAQVHWGQVRDFFRAALAEVSPRDSDRGSEPGQSGPGEAEVDAAGASEEPSSSDTDQEPDGAGSGS